MPKRRKGSEDGADHNGGNKSSKSSKKDGGDGGGGPNQSDENAIPIFLKKTYRMIETCDPDICSWSADGEMFVVKNPEVFAAEIIPQYFDHNKFSSFARQLNFYGFRKIQTKPIRNEDFDRSTAKHVTFFNEKFKRGRYDLLKEIQRSTRGGGAQASLADQQREMETLRSTVSTLEQRVQDLEGRWQEMAMKMEREIQAKVELAVMDLLSSRGGSMGAAAQAHQAGAAVNAAALQAQYMGMPQLPTSFGDAAILQRAERSFGSIGGRNPNTGNWENPLLGPQAARAFSTASASSMGQQGQGNKNMGGASGNGSDGAGGGRGGGASGGGGGGPTLAPHPKQKSLPPPTQQQGRGGLPQGASGGFQGQGGSNNGGGGGLQGGLHTMSGGLRNAWEDKFFSTLMMSDGASRAASLAGLASGMNPAGAGGMGAGNVSRLAALAAAQQMQQQNQHQAAMQMASNMGRGGGGGGGGGRVDQGGGSNNKVSQQSSALERQTTAEILLEAAGELGSGAKAEQKEGDEENRNVTTI